ncbi:Hypothetical predicted protein [Cloeon dipterum]|uniref:RRP15-like protein n=1 Tax=Cloeon dipterum TaxID=197152 RepID=A0A8S1CRJ6_9INSE|nr:Hypothetical predicted protein [Cloeon dipterum]
MALVQTRQDELTTVQNDSESGNSGEEGSDIQEEDSELDEEKLPSKKARHSGEESDGADASGSSDDEETPAVGNARWADAILKVLKTNKPKKKKTLVLSRAKKLNETVLKEEPKDPGFEIDGEDMNLENKTEDVDEKPDVKPILSAAELREQKKKRKLWETMSRSKPNVLAKDREKSLSKIATRGVVQLFNAVKKQQKDIEAELDDAGHSERKREKVLKSVDKNSFLDILMGPSKSVHIGRNQSQKVEPKEDKDDAAPIWSVLRDDFMMGDGKLKDWDKQEESGSEASAGESISDGDSDE